MRGGIFLIAQVLHRQPSQLAVGQLNTGQRRGELLGDLLVVVARQQHVLRDAHAVHRQRLIAANRQPVAGAEDGVRARVQFQQGRGGGKGLAELPVGLAHQSVVARESGLLQRRLIARQTLARGLHPALPGDVGDARGPTGDEVFRHLEGVGVVVRDKRRQQRRAGVALVEQHQRDAGAVLEGRHIHQRGDRRRENNPDAVALLQLADDVQRQLDVVAVVIDGEQGLVAPRRFPRLADGVDKRVEALHGADQQGDLFLVARGVNGGEAVVAELGGDANHPLAGVVAELDVAGLVKHQRYRRLRHPRRPRNIVHRHFRFSLHPSSPFRDFASYPNRAL